MKVTGDIWLLTSSGKLERYSRGAPVDFSMDGFPSVTGEGLSDPVALYVGEEEVYVLELKFVCSISGEEKAGLLSTIK